RSFRSPSTSKATWSPNGTTRFRWDLASGTSDEGRPVILRRSARWFDDRLRASSFAHEALNKVFPDNWSFMLGEIALYCFVILVLTGTFLTFFFTPSAKEVIYEGGYRPLRGTPIAEAYASVLKRSVDVRGGMVF